MKLSEDHKSLMLVIAVVGIAYLVLKPFFSKTVIEVPATSTSPATTLNVKEQFAMPFSSTTK